MRFPLKTLALSGITSAFLTTKVTAWNDGYGDIATGSFSVQFTGADQNSRSYEIHGENEATVSVPMGPPCDVNTIFWANSTWLPYPIGGRGGYNFCQNRLITYVDVGLTIEYDSLVVNLWSDSRCGHIDQYSLDHWRCVLPINP